MPVKLNVWKQLLSVFLSKTKIHIYIHAIYGWTIAKIYFALYLKRSEMPRG